MNRGIVSEPELVQVQIPIPMIVPGNGNNHGLQDSVDPLSGICLGMIHRLSGVDNVQALARLLNQAVRELGAIVRMDNFLGTPTRHEQVFKLSFNRGSSGTPFRLPSNCSRPIAE